jgi:drug/metabolite transporter (DMT)-like permease
MQGANYSKTASNAITGLVVMNVIWGAQFPFTKPALDVIPPFTFTLFRFLLAISVLLPLSGRGWIKLLNGPDRYKLLGVGIMGFCVAQVSQTLAIKMSLASDIALLSTSTPLWMALLARLWLGEKLSRSGRLGFLTAILGLLVILWPKDAGALDSGRIIGDAIFMITGFSWAYYNVKGKELMARHPPLDATAVAGLAGTICIFPFAGYEWITGKTLEFTLLALASVAYAGLLATALGFVVLYWALGRIRSVHAAVMMYLQPVSGVFFSWLLLEEQLGINFFLGALLVLTGVGLVSFQTVD